MKVVEGSKILIVDDDYLTVLHLETLFSENGYTVVGNAPDAAAAFSLAEKHRPHLIFMDIKINGKQDGIDAAERILKELNIPVIFLSGYDDIALIERAKRVKPLAFLLKPINERQILVELEIALYQARARRERLLFTSEEFPEELPPKYEELTPTEIRVAGLIRKGLSTKEISNNLDISPQTVMWHRKNIRKKLKLVNKGENLTMYLLQ